MNPGCRFLRLDIWRNLYSKHLEKSITIQDYKTLILDYADEELHTPLSKSARSINWLFNFSGYSPLFVVF